MSRKFKVGDLVTVKASGLHRQVIGLTGEVINTQYQSYWVMIPEHGSFSLGEEQLTGFSKKKNALYKTLKLYSDGI